MRDKLLNKTNWHSTFSQPIYKALHFTKDFWVEQIMFKIYFYQYTIYKQLHKSNCSKMMAGSGYAKILFGFSLAKISLVVQSKSKDCTGVYSRHLNGKKRLRVKLNGKHTHTKYPAMLVCITLMYLGNNTCTHTRAHRHRH